MKFDDLYELALEAAKNFGSPKNIGGSRLAGVKNSEKPSGYVSSSVGKADNFQERVPIDQKNKKGFDPKAAAKQRNTKLEVDDFDTGATDIRKKTDAEKVSVWDIINNKNKSIFNAFALLNNSQYFKEKMEEIRKDFWGNPKSKTEAGKKGLESVNIKDETALKNLRFQVSKNRGLIETLKDEINQYREVLNNYNASDDEKFDTKVKLEADEALFDKTVANIKKIGGGAKLVSLFNNLQTLSRRKSMERKKIGSPTSQLDIQKINLEISRISDEIREITASKPNLTSYVDKLFDLNYSIEELTPIYHQQNLKEKDIYGVEDKSKGILKILDEKKAKLQRTIEALEEDTKSLTAVENHTSRVSAYNEQKSKDAIAAFKKAVIMGAKNILDFKFKDFNPTSTNATEVDWESELPNRGEIYKMLNLLQSPDSTRNPIFKFIDQLDDPYLELSPNRDISRGVMRHDTDRNMSDNENITVVRDAQQLPFSIISNYYNTVNIATMPIGSVITSESFRAAYRQFNELCKRFEGNKERWDDPTVKEKMKTLLGINAAASPNKSMYNIGQALSTAITPPSRSMGEALPKHRKLAIERIIDDVFKVSGSGASSFKQLASMVDSDLASAFPRKFKSIQSKLLKGETIEESFDELANKYASSFNVDINDFMIDLQEVAVFLEKSKKCDGPTKKASSDRKGKKWTKCAKQPDGSYKRIHWGQAGVRVGKDNPKRRKSFRARHKCSSAKPGSPKAAACSDW